MSNTYRNSLEFEFDDGRVLSINALTEAEVRKYLDAIRKGEFVARGILAKKVVV